MKEFNTYMEGITPDAEGNSAREVGASGVSQLDKVISRGVGKSEAGSDPATRPYYNGRLGPINCEVKPKISSRDLVKEAEVSVADLDWPLIRRSVPNNYPLLLRDTTAPLFAEWLKDKAPWYDLLVLGGEAEFPDRGGVLELSLAASSVGVFRGVAPEGSPVHAVVRVKRYGVHMIEVMVDCQDVQAESACAELVLGIGGHWPEAVRRLRDQIDEEVRRNWSELDRELTLLLIGDEDSDALEREVRDWLNSHAVGVRWVIENLGRTIEVRLTGEEGALWGTACRMAEAWPALEPKVVTKLVERMQGDLEERLSRGAQRHLHNWLDEHSPEVNSSIGEGARRESEAEHEPIRDESQEEETPWEKIPNRGDDRQIVEFGLDDCTVEEGGDDFPDDRVVRSQIVPGTANHFRGLMERLVIQYTQRWESSDGKHLFFGEHRQERNGHDVTPPTRATWWIFLEPTEGRGYAGIETYELPDGRTTRVEFLDGYTPEAPKLNNPIGPAFEEFCELIINEMQNVYAGENSEIQGRRRSGRPGLDREELIYRLAKAQEGEEIKLEDPSMTWKEIARKIYWRQGSTRAGVKLLEDARHRLHRLQEDDPENLLGEVALFRAKERKET